MGAAHEGVPFVDVSGLFSYGNNFEGEIPQIGNTFQWSDNLSLGEGKPHLQIWWRYSPPAASIRRSITTLTGLYSYYGGGANDPDFEVDQGDGTTAENLMPLYLLGLPDSFSQGSAQVENVRSSIFAVFAQDSWKIRKNLTLNYGLRWELFTPLTDVSQHVQSFRPGQTSTVYPCQFTDPVMTSIFNDAGVADPNCDNTGAPRLGCTGRQECARRD